MHMLSNSVCDSGGELSRRRRAPGRAGFDPVQRDRPELSEIGTADRAAATPSRSRRSNCWHLDEDVVRIAGERPVRSAIDHESEALDMPVQRRATVGPAANAQATQEAGLRAEMGKLRSYASAFRHLPLTCRDEQRSGD
jgi:transposase-like protein